MNRGEEEENWKREIGSFKSLSVQMGFIFTALVLYHTFCRKYLPTSANTQPPYPFADMFDMYLKMGSNRF